MGISFPSLRKDNLWTTPALPVGLDVTKYTIEKTVEIGNYTILLIRYHECLEWGGLKILVFEQQKLDRFKKGDGGIDPHFFESKNSPIARFIPTDNGWEMAKLLCEKLELQKELKDLKADLNAFGNGSINTSPRRKIFQKIFQKIL